MTAGNKTSTTTKDHTDCATTSLSTIITIAVCLLLLGGCNPPGPSELERVSLQLEAGLTKAEVASMFSRFDVIHEMEGGALNSATRVFQTNKPVGSYTVYGHRKGRNPQGFFENCTISFDENEAIVAYRYEVMD